MTTLEEILNPDDLQRAMAEGLVNARPNADGWLIYNYSKRAPYTPGAWDNPAVRACRGIIVDTHGNVRARPWEKFFGHAEPHAGALDLHSLVEVTDKSDGVLGILYVDARGHQTVSSRGRLDSLFAVEATKMLRENNYSPGWHKNFTPLVEIIYPESRIILKYEFSGLVLLGGVWIETGNYVGPLEAASLTSWNGRVAQVFEYASLQDALLAPPRQNAEGLVVRYLGQNRLVKIKQSDYVQLNRIITGLNKRAVWEHLMEHRTIDGLLDNLPDELHAWTLEVYNTLIDEMERIHTVVLDTFAEIETPDRKEFAARAMKFPKLKYYLFAVYDNKDEQLMIMKNLKPSGEDHAVPEDEDTA